MDNETIQDIKTGTKVDTININIIEIEKAKELFNSCKYQEAEQIFAGLKGSDAGAWRILCHIITGDIGRRGGKIPTLLQELIRNQEADINDTIISLNALISEYESAIDRKTKNKVVTLLYDVYNSVMKEKMAITISDVNKRALQIVKEKGYTPSIYDDKTIPVKVLNRRLKKHKYRIRHYKPEDITHALEIINSEKFVQEVVDEYMSIAHSHMVHIKDHLDTRSQDILKYIRSLYISNIAYEKELKFTGSMDKLQFIDALNKLNERGWLRIKMSNTENTRYFNMANDEEKTMCETEIKRLSSTTNVIVSLAYENTIERRGYIIYDGIVNQISKEDIAIGDATSSYTYEYVGPVPGIIYFDN